jgi:hypothetical protein
MEGILVFNGVPLTQLRDAFYAGVSWDELTIQEKGAFLEFQRWKYLQWRDN